MKGIMLTCQKRNKAAFSFYKHIKLGTLETLDLLVFSASPDPLIKDIVLFRYSEDAISPCNADPYASPEDYPYEILSKIFFEDAQRVLLARAKVAKNQHAQEYV